VKLPKDQFVVLPVFFALAIIVLLVAATAPSFLIGNGKLTTPLNGNGYGITNL